MLDKDFYWCYNHENLFRLWLKYRHNMRFELNDLLNIPLDSSSDSNSTFLLWQEAKKYALEIANSVDPSNLFKIRLREILTIKPDESRLIMLFLNNMLVSSKNKNLEFLADLSYKMFREAFRDFLRLHSIKKDKISIHEFENLDDKSKQDLFFITLMSGQIESDYDYSLPDGGITETITKTITKTDTDETKTQTDETKTDETITKTITKTKKESVDVILPKYNALNDVDFISAMQKAIKIGWIEEIEDGRYKWIGPTLIGTKKIKGYSNAALAYFIAKALKIKMELKADKTPTEDSYVDINKKFPENYDIKEVFGLDIQSDQLVNALRAKNIQKWRKVIDDFFNEELVRRDL